MSKETIKYLTSSETAMLFQQIDRDTSRHALRNRALFRLAKYCALRAGEPGLLLETDLDLDNMHIYCRREKSSQNNIIRLLEQDVVNALIDYLQVKHLLYPNSPLLFPSQKGSPMSRQMLDYLIKFYCRKTDIPQSKRHFHVIKHTRAVELADRGLDIKELQWWLGHKNVSNTLIYMQFTTKQQDALYRKHFYNQLIDMPQLIMKHPAPAEAGR